MTDLPKTPAGAQLEWVLDNVKKGFGSVSEDEIRERFAPEFLKQVPASALGQVGAQLKVALEGFTVETLERESAHELVAVLALPSQDKFRASIAVLPEPPHKIRGLLVQMAPDLRPEPVAKTWDELGEKLRGLSSRAGFLAGEILDGEVVPMYEVNPEEHLAIGSAFKLYILGRVAQEIASSASSWADEIPVEARHKSWPTGDMQNEKAGTKFTLEHFATKMISISDNTATDHLLAHAGREDVEEFQSEMGHSRPDLNVPFLSTREMVLLKVGLAAKDTEAYIASTKEERRRTLDGVLAKRKLPPISKAEGWSSPRWIESVEWFASAGDMCRAMAKLKTLGEADKTVLNVLSVNPGAQFDRYAWTYVGYKGGGEPGVLNFTWLLKRLDDRWFVMSLCFNDPAASPNVMEGISLAMAAATFLVMHRKKTRKGGLLGGKRR